MRILTWHIHGSYLYYLVQARHDFYLPVKPDRPAGYSGRSGAFPWPDNVHEVPAEQVKNLDFDVILFQSRQNYLQDQFEILTEEQRRLPRLYLEHDPPREVPTDTRHIVDDPNLLLVHCTNFNNLMWDSNRTPTMVIDHGVIVPEQARYTGELERGITVINGLKWRGRRLGADIFERVRRQIPLDLAGMQSEDFDGLGDIPHTELSHLEGRYRFFFNPIRYTSMGLSVIEAMLIGMPIIGLATTEMVTAIENGVSGYIDTNIDNLVERMRELLQDPAAAKRLGEGAQQAARERFGIERFARDWDRAFQLVASNHRTASPIPAGESVTLTGHLGA